MLRSAKSIGSAQAGEQRNATKACAFSSDEKRHSPYSGIADDGCQNGRFYEWQIEAGYGQQEADCHCADESGGNNPECFAVVLGKRYL